MAAKSDFAQKLLHDLKVRKERMASSQSSHHSNSTARDTYRNSGQTYRGSRQTKALESVGSKTVNQRTRSSASSRSLDIRESSQQIVSYERNGSSDYIGDLSMAFAYALQNGGNAGKLDFSSKNSSMIDFLHQIGRRSFDIGKMDRKGSFNMHRSSTSYFPTISHIHVKEISKGVQNLNQILRACSNGIDFDKYSIEVGKELLKGAKGLEESLRMLVNLQEASEYMVSPQRKNQSRFTLLDEDEEDEDHGAKIIEQKQLDLPIFSFDKRSRNSHGTKGSTSQRQMDSTDPRILIPHTRSASCVDFRTLTTLSEMKSSSSSVKPTSEKGRISNVIAKLMGLEEVPERVESHSARNASSSKKKDGIVAKSPNTNTKNTELSKVDAAKSGLMTGDAKAVKPANRIQQTQTSNAVSLKTEKIKVSSSANGRGQVLEGKQQKDLQRENVITGALSSSEPSVDKLQSHIGQSNQIPRNGQDNERGDAMHTEQKRRAEGSKEVADGLQENIIDEINKVQTETINEDRLVSNNHQRPKKEQELRQQHMPTKLDQHNKKHATEKSNQQMSKQDLHMRKQDKSQINSKVSSTPVHAATNLQKKQLHTKQGVSSKKSDAVSGVMPLKELADNKQNKDFANRKVPQKELELKKERETGSDQTIRKEKSLYVPQKRKKEDSMYTREPPRKINEVISRRNGALDKLARSSKTHRSIMQELKQRSEEKMSSLKGVGQLNSSWFKELVISIKSEPNIQRLNGSKPIQEEDETATTAQIAGGDECQSPKAVQSPTPKDQSENLASEILTISKDQKDEAPDYMEDVEPMYQDNLQNPLVAGAYEGRVEISHAHEQQEHKKVSTRSTHVVLTENEKHLKEILIKGHLFLNTAEALFKLNIPVGILHTEDHNRQDCETKLKLDCGNELMRRKVRNQELINHPYMTISIMHTKIRSLDELVKQLYKDFKSLTFYVRKEGDHELDDADYLHKMLERDLHGKDQEINSVWDFGWNEMMFPSVEKEDVTRDLEKYLLNGLIDEITQDLVDMTLSF